MCVVSHYTRSGIVVTVQTDGGFLSKDKRPEDSPLDDFLHGKYARFFAF